MQTGHWVALVGLAMMLTGLNNVSGIGFVVFVVGCYMCDPNKVKH